MIGILGSTEAMASRTRAVDRPGPGTAKMTMSCRKSEPLLLRAYSACARDAHHFELTAGSRFAAEVLAIRIFILEKLSCKRLIDDCYVSRSRCILFGDAAPSDDRVSDDLEISRRNSLPPADVVSRRQGGGGPSHQTP